MASQLSARAARAIAMSAEETRTHLSENVVRMNAIVEGSILGLNDPALKRYFELHNAVCDELRVICEQLREVSEYCQKVERWIINYMENA